MLKFECAFLCVSVSVCVYLSVGVSPYVISSIGFGAMNAIFFIWKNKYRLGIGIDWDSSLSTATMGGIYRRHDFSFYKHT
jgi:hypothetical protein